MTCNCTCNSFQHRVTALTQGSASVEMTVTNNTNVSSLDYFELFLTVNPNSVVTGAPLPYTITINGTAAIPVLNKYALPIYSNRLKMRKRYYGRFVTSGSNSWVILVNTPCDVAYATP